MFREFLPSSQGHFVNDTRDVYRIVHCCSSKGLNREVDITSFCLWGMGVQINAIQIITSFPGSREAARVQRFC